LRKNAQKYKDLGISIIIIVGQKQQAVEKWLKDNPMPFPFLIDEDRSVIKAFDVYHPFGLTAYKISHPSLFLISPEGKVVYSYVGKNQSDRPTDQETYKQVHQLLSVTD
jgi:methyl-accepting chemotaxis protein